MSEPIVGPSGGLLLIAYEKGDRKDLSPRQLRHLRVLVREEFE